MKLIYAYIENYRTFEDCDINFSNQFNIKYDKNNFKLEITENPDYIDIYPNHINDINAVVGKNSTGKTSLLELIGKRIDERVRNEENVESTQYIPYRYRRDLIINKAKESRGFNISYFLIYFMEYDENDNPIFVMETDYITKYLKIFANSNRMAEFKDCSWDTVYFKKQDNKLLYLKCCNNDYNDTSIASIGYGYSKRSCFKDLHNPHGIDRAYIDLKYITVYEKLKFLIRISNKEREQSTLYKNSQYSAIVNIKTIFDDDYYNLLYIDDNSIIKEYINCNSSKENDKYLLAFVELFVRMIYIEMICRNSEIENYEKEQISKALYNINSSEYTYETMLSEYHKQAEIILKRYNKNHEELSINELYKAESSLIEFFDKAKENKINYEFLDDSKGVRLIINLDKHSSIDNIKNLFENIVDVKITNIRKETYSLMDDFTQCEIKFFSAGEEKNLDLYTALDEYIIGLNGGKKYKEYILAFDEIENSMHPEMCRRLIYDLIEFLENYPKKKFQIIIGSHSPFILSDIPSENVICLDKKNNKTVVSKSEENTFAQNIHTLLKSTFFVEKTMGEYSLDIIRLIIDSMDNINKSPQQVIEKLNSQMGYNFNSVSNNLTKRFKSVEDARQFILYVINQIGEPVLRKVLMDKYNETLDIDEQIKQKEEELNELKAKRDRQE